MVFIKSFAFAFGDVPEVVRKLEKKGKVNEQTEVSWSLCGTVEEDMMPPLPVRL